MGSQKIEEILSIGIKMYGNQKLILSRVIIKMREIIDNIHNWEVIARKDRVEYIDDKELKKELGNIIFFTILWCNDLGYNPEDCIKLSIKCQKGGEE